MSSKKKRKKLKEQYIVKEPNEHFKKDGEKILNYLRTHPNKFIKAKEIIQNNNLYYDTTSGVSFTVKSINDYTDYNIKTKPSSNGGYIYYA